MERRLFWLFYVFAAINRAWNLTCYCGGATRLCTGDADVCPEPTDVCFVSIKIASRTSTPTFDYACQELGNGQFDSFWQNCLVQPVVQEYSSLQCCNNEDLCNQHLSPLYPLSFANATTNQAPTTTPVEPTAESSARTVSSINVCSGCQLSLFCQSLETQRIRLDPNIVNRIYVGLTVAVPVFAVLLVIVMITVAIIYCFKKKTMVLDCSRCGCCNKQARVEPIYDVPDYFAMPSLPPHKEKPTTECDDEQDYCEIHDDDGNQYESLQQQCTHDHINNGIFCDPEIHIPNLEVHHAVNCTEPVNLHVDSEIMPDEAEVPEMQQNSSYLASTDVSDIAVNPAYGTNVATAPEILTEQNEAYEVRNSGMDNH